MTQLNTQLRTLVTKGLYGDNLSALLSLAKESFHQSPALYGTLIYVFEPLIAEYNDQAIPTSRYEHIVQHLTQPLLDALDAESAPPQQLLDKLNKLHAAFFTL